MYTLNARNLPVNYISVKLAQKEIQNEKTE